MRSILHVALNDIRVLFRDKFALFWIFGFPLLFAIFFGAIAGEGGSRGAMSVAVVDEAQNADSAALLARLDESAAIRLDRDEGGALTAYDLEAAQDLVRKGNRTAYLRLPPGYQSVGFEIFGGGEVAAEDALEAGIDPARKAEAGYLQGLLAQSIFQGLGAMFQDTDALKGEIRKTLANVEGATDMDPIFGSALKSFMGNLESFIDLADLGSTGDGAESDEGEAGFDMGGSLVTLVDVARDESGQPHSPFDVMFPSAILWGLLGCLSGFSITLVRERVAGTLLRLQVAPMSRMQLLAGKGLACLLACLVVSVFLLAVGYFFMGVQIGSPWLLIPALVCTGVCFTGLMMLASVLGKTEQAVAGAGWGLMMPLAMIGGAMVPLIAMPQWMLTLSNISPVKWGILAIEGAVWRDFTPTDMLLPCGILLAIGAVVFGIGVTLFNRMT